ncbi:hypothetical protein ACNQUF_12540, partial [Corynebacterium diphtheriae]
MRHGVRGLERGDDAFELREPLERVEHGRVVLGHVPDTADAREVGVLRADARVVQARGDRVHRVRGAVVVGEDE